MQHECSTLGTLSLTAPLPTAVDAAAPEEEAAHASDPVTAGVSTPSLPLPSSPCCPLHAHGSQLPLHRASDVAAGPRVGHHPTDRPRRKVSGAVMRLVVQVSRSCPRSRKGMGRYGHPSREVQDRTSAVWRAERPIAGRPKAPRSSRERAPVSVQGSPSPYSIPGEFHASSSDLPGGSGTPEHGFASTRGGSS
jgi:hypothetical protein